MYLVTNFHNRRFPLYDLAGRIYTTEMPAEHGFGAEYLVDSKQAGFLTVLLYKEAKWFYSIMILLSGVMGVTLWP